MASNVRTRAIVTSSVFTPLKLRFLTLVYSE
jgi:hypothetical protein